MYDNRGAPRARRYRETQRLRVVAGGLAFALCIGLAMQSVPASAHTPSAVFPAIVSNSNVPGLSVQVAKTIKPSGGVVWLAPNGNDLAFAQASANAAVTSGVAVMAESFNPEEVRTQLAVLAPAKVEFVGPSNQFSSAFRLGLAQYFATADQHVTAGSLGWSVAVNEPSAREKLVVTDSATVAVRELAASLAIATSSSLLIVDELADPVLVGSIAADSLNALITIVGPMESVAAFTAGAEAARERVMWLDTEDETASGEAALEAMVAAGRDAPRVVAATDGGLAVRAIASSVARATDSVVAPLGVARGYVERFRSSLSNISVVGLTASRAHVLSLSSSWQTPHAAPDFRVEDIQYTSNAASHTITVSPISGAARYRAYDIDGVQIGASTSTALTVSGAPESALVVAERADGGEIRRVDVHLNQYTGASDRDLALVGSASNGRTHLSFLGGAGLPRLVTRTQVDVQDMSIVPDPERDTVTLGITCDGTFTDIIDDPSKQYDYRVRVLNNDRESCSQSPSVSPNDTPAVMGVTIPALAEPFGVQARRGNSGDLVETAPRRSGRSLFDLAIADSALKESAIGSSPMAIQSLPSIRFRYQAWIRASLAPGLPRIEPSGIWHDFFGGDGRDANPNGSYRYRQDMRINFGAGGGYSYSENMGETKKYSCRFIGSLDCRLMARDAAPLSGLWDEGRVYSSTKGTFTLRARAANPLQVGAPPIDANLRFDWKLGGTTVTGSHDRMPSHEIWFDVAGWNEWQHVYSTKEVGLHCLVGTLPGCRQNVNVRI